MEDTEGKITPRISMSVIVLVSTLFLGGVLFVIGYIVSRLSRSNKPSDSIKSKHCHKEILLAISPLRLLAEKNHACVFANHSRRQVRFSFLFAFSLADRDKEEISQDEAKRWINILHSWTSYTSNVSMSKFYKQETTRFSALCFIYNFTRTYIDNRLSLYSRYISNNFNRLL